MKTIETKVYTYDELNDDAKEKAASWYLEGAYEYDWYEFIYEEAKQLGFTIEGFDLYRKQCDIKLNDTLEAIAKKIIAEHGKDTPTYKTANDYLKSAAIPSIEEKNEELEEEFTHALAENYRALLQAEYDYIGSEEEIAERMEANEYTFTEDGKRFG